MGATDTEHDVIIIGAGPAGEVCSAALAREGLDVALIERELVGGECAYWACMPSKALLRPLELLAEARRVPGAREAISGPVDPQAVLRRRDEVIHGLDDEGKRRRLTDRGVKIVTGAARLSGPRRVTIGDGERVLTARRAVVIAAGSDAARPPIPGLADLDAWTNREGSTAAAVPDSLIVLGGGAVGCELAQAWSALGARTTLIETHPRLLAGEEPFVGDLLQRALTAQGVDVRAGATVTAAQPAAGGGVTLTLTRAAAAAAVAPAAAAPAAAAPAAAAPAAAEDRLTARELLVATGRRPNTGDLGLDTLGLSPGETIDVDDQMRVPAHADWLYAIGDVNGRSLLTHSGKYQAFVAAATIMGRAAEATHDRGGAAPRVVFTDPQVAAVGLTLEQAREAGIDARAIDADPEATAGGSFVGKGAPANVRIVVDEQRNVIVGATFCGPDVAESLHAATIAVAAEIPIARLFHAIPTFPTRSEVWLTLLSDWRP